MTYLKNNQNQIISALMDAGTGSTSQVLVDRSRGLFHPNANGVAVLACRALTQYQGTSGSDCRRATSPASDTVNGNPVGSRPLQTAVQGLLQFVISGFGPNAPIIINEYSKALPLGTTTADAQGTVHFSLALPPNNPGVHQIQFAGASATGAAVTKSVRVAYPGRPAGDTYSAYVCGFTPSPTTYDPADVRYAGQQVMTLPVDENGCVLVEVPLLSLPRGPFDVPLTVTEQSTGVIQQTSVRAVPRVVGVWATSTASDAVSVSGAGSSVQGLLHSDGGVNVSAAGVTVDATEYASSAVVNVNSQVGSRTQVIPGGLPTSRTISDYRPGGPVAVASPGAYHAIPASACVNGAWKVVPSQVPGGVVYVPCAVVLTAPGSVAATIAAEGSITVAASTVSVRPTGLDAPALVSGQSVVLSGAAASVGGMLLAPAGAVTVSGSGAVVRCGIVARTVAVVGAKSQITVDDRCVTG